MRGAPGHLELHGGDTGRRQANGVLQAGALERQHQVVLRSELGDERPGTRGTDFLIAVDQHGDETVVAETERLERGDGMKDEGDAVLVVGDAESIRAIAVDSKGLLRQHAPRIHGVHVRKQENPLGPGAAESAHDRLASPRWCVLEPHHARRRVDELDIAAERSQTPGNEIGDAIQSFDIRAAGLDGHQLPQRFEVRLLLALCSCQHRVRSLCEYPRGEQRGDGDEDKA